MNCSQSNSGLSQSRDEVETCGGLEILGWSRVGWRSVEVSGWRLKDFSRSSRCAVLDSWDCSNRVGRDAAKRRGCEVGVNKSALSSCFNFNPDDKSDIDSEESRDDEEDVEALSGATTAGAGRARS